MRLSVIFSIIVPVFLSFVFSSPTGTPDAHALDKRNPTSSWRFEPGDTFEIPIQFNSQVHNHRRVVVMGVLEKWLVYVPLSTHNQQQKHLHLPEEIQKWRDERQKLYTWFSATHLFFINLDVIEGDRKHDRLLSSKEFDVLMDYTQKNYERYRIYEGSCIDRSSRALELVKKILGVIVDPAPPPSNLPLDSASAASHLPPSFPSSKSVPSTSKRAKSRPSSFPPSEIGPSTRPKRRRTSKYAKSRLQPHSQSSSSSLAGAGLMGGIAPAVDGNPGLLDKTVPPGHYQPPIGSPPSQPGRPSPVRGSISRHDPLPDFFQNSGASQVLTHPQFPPGQGGPPFDAYWAGVVPSGSGSGPSNTVHQSSYNHPYYDATTTGNTLFPPGGFPSYHDHWTGALGSGSSSTVPHPDPDPPHRDPSEDFARYLARFPPS